MEYTHRFITYWKDKNFKARSYSTLASNNEESFIKWLYQQGIIVNHTYGMECHDIGDTDYFAGGADAGDIDSILSFVSKIYGEWSLDVAYEGVKIQIRKQYPNIVHNLSFRYPKDCEEKMSKFFSEFEETFCYPEIKEWVKFI